MKKLVKYQVWIGGWDLFDTTAESEREARENARRYLGVKRLPKDTGVCKIPDDYYQKMHENNEAVNRDVLNANPWLCATDL